MQCSSLQFKLSLAENTTHENRHKRFSLQTSRGTEVSRFHLLKSSFYQRFLKRSRDCVNLYHHWDDGMSAWCFINGFKLKIFNLDWNKSQENYKTLSEWEFTVISVGSVDTAVGGQSTLSLITFVHIFMKVTTTKYTLVVVGFVLDFVVSVTRIDVQFAS